jgi:hypothetical protein
MSSNADILMGCERRGKWALDLTAVGEEAAREHRIDTAFPAISARPDRLSPS